MPPALPSRTIPDAPDVSVLIATRNHARFLPQCLESLLAQTLAPQRYELIVIDDGSTDATRRVLRAYRAKVIAIRLPRQAGVVAACNRGLSRARGELVIRVDSDDWVEPDALERGVRAMREHPEMDLLLMDYWRERGSRRALVALDPRNVFSWTAAGIMMRTDAVRRAGGYRAEFWEEFDLYLRMLAQGAKAMRVPMPLWHYRKHPLGRSATRRARLAGWEELLGYWPARTLVRYGRDRELAQVLAGGAHDGTDHHHR